ncbi:MAG: sugar phosphate nucleotidyltransferase [Vicinamibacterales bacterium]
MTDLSAWPALVLTAGLATRLRPLSALRAKAALPVAGTPIVRRILAWLAAAGVRRAVLNLHHRPADLTALVGDGSDLGLAVRYSWEPRLLGSAGGPRRALDLLDAGRFLIVNGDTLTDVDLPALAAAHVAAGAQVTMAVAAGDVARYGGVIADERGAVTGFARGAGRHFVGVQAVEAAAFRGLPEGEPAETVRALYPSLIAARPGAVRTFESGAGFLDVGTPADYLETVALVAGRERQPFDVGTGCRIAAAARVGRSVLWDRVTVAPGARLTNCVVTDDVSVPAGAAYEDAVLVAGPAGVEVTPLA